MLISCQIWITWRPTEVLSQCDAELYIVEDNEAVIKMIIKGRSPMMRRVSRTYRVALDWLFDRINLDPKTQIKCVDTKNQLADFLAKGSFTRDEWNHVLRLFNVMTLSMFSRSRVRSVEKATVTSKRIQERKKEEEPAVAKLRSVCLIPTRLNRGPSSSFGPDVSCIPVDPQLGWASVKGAAGNCERDFVQGAAGNCRQDIVQNRVQHTHTQKKCSQVLK